MSDWLPLEEAAGLLGKSGRTVRRWRSHYGAPGSLYTKRGRVAYVDLPGLRSWAEGANLLEQGRGRPSDLDVLTRGNDLTTTASAPAAAPASPSQKGTAKQPPAPPRAATAATAAPANLTDDDRSELQRLGAGEASDWAALPSGVIKRLSAAAKARKDLADAAAKELANRKRSGELVEADDVVRFWREQVGIVQAAFRSMPGRLAPRLADASYDEVHRVLEEELAEVLRTFAVTVPRLTA